jgi:hypothetical protein
MNTKWSGLVTLGVVAAITVVGFLAWVLGLVVLWFILRRLGTPTDLWAMVEALSTAVAAATVLGGGILAYRELSEVASSRHMEVADRLFEELNSTENVKARRWIFQNLPEDPREGIKTLGPEGRDAVKRALNSLDRVAFLTQAGWIPQETIMPWMHPMVAKLWDKLEPYVRYEQERRNEPYYYEQAAELAERCRAWREKHLAAGEVVWLEDAL